MNFYQQFLPLLLASCTMGPTSFEKDGQKMSFTTAGVSVLTKSDYDKSSVTNGAFRAEHETFKKNEIGVPVMKMTEVLGGAILDEIVPVTDAIKGN
jgi:hypothetical protein